MQFYLKVVSENGRLSVVSGVEGFASGLRQFGGGVGRQALDGVEVEPLLDGHELPAARLHHFLGGHASHSRVHRAQVPRTYL